MAASGAVAAQQRPPRRAVTDVLCPLSKETPVHESTRSIPHPSSQPTARGRRLLRLSVLPLTAALCLPAALAAPAFAQSLPSATGTAAHEDGAGQDDIVVTEDNVDSWWHTIIGFLTGDDQDRDQDRGQDHDEERDQGQEQSEEGAAIDGAPAGAEVEEDDNPASTPPWNDPNPFAGAAPYADPTYTSAERAESPASERPRGCCGPGPHHRRWGVAVGR